MLVSQILKTKGDMVFTSPPTATMAAVAAQLHARQVGAVVVMGANDEVVGILSERDLVRVVAMHGEAGLSEPISACMTRDVLFASPTETLDALLARMTDRRVRHLPVVQGGRLVGLVSIGDLVKWKIAESEAVAEDLKAYIAHA
jgi:CBS domain-containing protein